MNQYQKRLEKIYDWMAEEGIALAFFEDAEGKRDTSIRYLTGHPCDALLFLSVERKNLLAPWDINLAKVFSRVQAIVPYNDFKREPLKAVEFAADFFKLPSGSKIEIPPVTSYPDFLNFIEEFPGFDIICRKESTSSYVKDLRTIKDDDEIAIIRKAADITNIIISLLEKNVRSGKIKTEADAVMLIEHEARKRGCEGTSFDTLAAGPNRSFCIHAFPSYTGASFGGQGLSILDFGIRYCGYCTDVTLTFAREANNQQKKMVNLVEKAAAAAMDKIVIGNDISLAATAVDKLFAKAKKQMAHGLGHGIGLDVHEYPFIKSSFSGKWVLRPGMVFSIEPGLYDPLHGGCRLENDILMTEHGYEVLTEASVIWL